MLSSNSSSKSSAARTACCVYCHSTKYSIVIVAFWVVSAMWFLRVEQHTRLPKHLVQINQRVCRAAVGREVGQWQRCDAADDEARLRSRQRLLDLHAVL